MSILIKGMDMPTSCWECEICSLSERLKYKESRNPNCPLVEIPTPHGRLVDADDIKAKCINEVFESMGTVAITDPSFDDEWADDICDVPTILEAEE